MYSGVEGGAQWQYAYLRFQTHTTNSSTLTDTLTLTGGNVGIGTTSPVAKLDVSVGDIFLTANYALKSGGSYANSSGIKLYNGSTGDMEFTQFSTATYARFNANMSIAGNVGINRTAPGAQLDVLSGATNRVTAIFDTSASNSGYNTIWKCNGASRVGVVTYATAAGIEANACNFGNNLGGAYLYAGNNISAGAEGPAAGVLFLVEAGGTNSVYWTDAAHKLRYHTAQPTGSSGTPTVADTAGAVVGDQTSWHELKNILGPAHAPEYYLSELLRTQVERFTYKDHQYSVGGIDPIMTGLVIYNKNEWYAKNCDRDQIPCLNEVNVAGYLVQSIKALHELYETDAQKITRLEACVTELELNVINPN